MMSILCNFKQKRIAYGSLPHKKDYLIPYILLLDEINFSSPGFIIQHTFFPGKSCNVVNCQQLVSYHSAQLHMGNSFLFKGRRASHSGKQSDRDQAVIAEKRILLTEYLYI